MRTGTGQTLPVGTVFRCTEGNRWDIRQLPEPADWFYIGSRHHRYPAFFGAPMSTGMISCNSQSLPVGIIGPQITANASIVASWFSWIAFWLLYSVLNHWHKVNKSIVEAGKWHIFDSRDFLTPRWKPAWSISGISGATIWYRHHPRHRPKPPSGNNRPTNNCECSILVFSD